MYGSSQATQRCVLHPYLFLIKSSSESVTEAESESRTGVRSQPGTSRSSQPRKDLFAGCFCATRDSIDANYVEPHCFTQWSTLSDRNNVALVKTETRRSMTRYISMPPLVPLVLGTPMKIVPSHNDCTGHFCAHNSATENTPSDAYITRKGTLFVDVVALDGFPRSFNAKTNRLEPSLFRST